MFPVIFDTFKFVQKLKAAGMPEPQAIALSEAQNEMLLETTTNLLATKADLQALREELKADVQMLKEEISDLRHEVKEEIADLRLEVKQDIALLTYNQKLNHWMMGFVLTGIAGLVIKSFFG